MMQTPAEQYEMNLRPKLMLQSFGFFEEQQEEGIPSPVQEEKIKTKFEKTKGFVKGIVLKTFKRTI